MELCQLQNSDNMQLLALSLRLRRKLIAQFGVTQSATSLLKPVVKASHLTELFFFVAFLERVLNSLGGA